MRAAQRSAISESAEQEMRAAQQTLSAAHNSNVCLRKQSGLPRAETAILSVGFPGLASESEPLAKREEGALALRVER